MAPYSHATALIGSRVQEAKTLHRACSHQSVTPDAQRSIRGLIYITLHGMYEATLSACVLTALDLADSHAISNRELKPGLCVFALKPQFDSCRDVSAGKVWTKNLELLNMAQSESSAQLQQAFPADGSFMKKSQLELIWTLFDLPGDPWPLPRLISRIQELVEARNRIAHGAEAAESEGRRLTDGEMEERINDIEALCLHLVSSFSSSLASRSAFMI